MEKKLERELGEEQKLEDLLDDISYTKKHKKSKRKREQEIVD